MIKKVEVRVFKLKLFCDICGNEMEYIMEMRPFAAHQLHKCNNCRHSVLIKEKYPIIKYEEFEGGAKKQ